MGRQAHDCYTLVVTGTSKFFSTLLIEGSVSRNWSSEVVTIVGLPTICKMTDASRFINSYLLRMHSATLISQLDGGFLLRSWWSWTDWKHGRPLSAIDTSGSRVAALFADQAENTLNHQENLSVNKRRTTFGRVGERVQEYCANQNRRITSHGDLRSQFSNDQKGLKFRTSSKVVQRCKRLRK